MRAPLTGTLRKDGYWAVVVTLTHDDGTKTRKTFARKKRTEAVQAAKEYLLKNGRKAKAPHTFAELVEECRRSRWKGLSQNTVDQYEWALTRAEKRFGKLADIRLIETPAVAGWLRDLDEEESLGGRSVQVHRNALRIALHHAVELGWIDRNPVVQGMRLPSSPKPAPRRRLSAFEAQAIIKAEPLPERRLLWWLLMESGARPVEATRMHEGSLVYSQDMWWVQVAKSKTDAGTLREIPVSDALAAELHKIEGAWFPTINFETGNDRGTVSKFWKKACENAGVPHTNLYQLRKLRISLWRAAGVSDDAVIAMAGHTDIQVAREHYDDFDRARIKAALDGKG